MSKPAEMTKKSREIPSEIILSIFSFLDPNAWSRSCGLVCKSWRDVSNSDALWQPKCNALWKNKANVTIGMPFPRARYQNNVDFSVKELKFILGALSVDTSQLIEKSEYKDALQRATEKLVDRLYQPVYPKLSGKWKASYVFSLIDSSRTYITEDELCKIQWRFFFKSNPFDFSATARFDYNKKTMTGRFNMNPWPMDNVSELPWKRNGAGDIVIHHFPGHELFRRPDWSFGMQNDHVIFYQIHEYFDQQQVQSELLEQYH
jgi:hypothetical protein